MKRVFFISNLNLVMKEVNQVLMNHFFVQLCPPDIKMIKGFLSMLTPDAVIVCLSDMKDEEDGIFALIRNELDSIPVLVIGSEAEMVRGKEAIAKVNAIRLIRPITNENVYVTLCDILGEDIDHEYRVSISEEGAKKHILCVDDSMMTLKILKKLIPNKYRASYVTSATQAIGVMQKDRPDMVFLDYEMPIVDGRQALEMIRAESALKDLPVVFLTGKSDRDSIKAVLDLKPAGYLLKPPVPEQIVQMIEKVLGEK